MCLRKIKIKNKEYKVKYIHERKWHYCDTDEAMMGEDDFILPKGGTTIAFITDKDNNVITCGIAECSKKDTYDKNFGRMIATGRLLKNLNMDTKLALEK